MDREVVNIAGFVLTGITGVVIEHGLRRGLDKVLKGGALFRREPLEPDAFKQIARLADNILNKWGTSEDIPDNTGVESPEEADNVHTKTTEFRTDNVNDFPATKVGIQRGQAYIPSTEESQPAEWFNPWYMITVSSGRDSIRMWLSPNLPEIKTPSELENDILDSSEAKTRIRARRVEMPDVRRTISILTSINSHPTRSINR